MPPRLLSPLRITACHSRAIRPSNEPPGLGSLFAGLFVTPTATAREASILASLRDNRDAYQKRIRLGRGASSDKGKTSGRGHKGQGQHGHVKPWFQGGQTPLIVSKGRKGFYAKDAPRMATVAVAKLQQWIDDGRIDPTKRITVKELIETRLVGNYKAGIKLIGGRDRGMTNLRQPVDIMVSRASSSAIKAVESAGGKILTRFYTRQSITDIMRGLCENTDKPLPVGKEHVARVLAERRSNTFRFRLPDPTSRVDIEYYRDPAHRGYLSHLLKEGESPSLFFRVPIPKQRVDDASRTTRKQDKSDHEELLW